MSSKVASAARTPEPTLPGAAPASTPRATNAAKSYHKLEAAILALPAGEVGRVTANVGQAASTALGALPNLRKLKKDFRAVFCDAEALLQRLDNLEDYALAAFYANARALPTSGDAQTKELLERGRTIRKKLLTIAEALVSFEVLDAVLVKNIRRGQGPRDTVQDLVALAALFNTHWERVKDSVPFDLAFVQEAASVGSSLLQALGMGLVPPVKQVQALDWPALRARAFRLLVREYEPLRRAVIYLRWEKGDANAFAPALHVGARKSRRSG